MLATAGPADWYVWPMLTGHARFFPDLGASERAIRVCCTPRGVVSMCTLVRDSGSVGEHPFSTSFQDFWSW